MSDLEKANEEQSLSEAWQKGLRFSSIQTLNFDYPTSGDFTQTQSITPPWSSIDRWSVICSLEKGGVWEPNQFSDNALMNFEIRILENGKKNRWDISLQLQARAQEKGDEYVSGTARVRCLMVLAR